MIKRILKILTKKVQFMLLITFFVNMVMLVGAKNYVEPILHQGFYYFVNSALAGFNIELILSNLKSTQNEFIAVIHNMLNTLRFINGIVFLIMLVSTLIVQKYMENCFSLALSFHELELNIKANWKVRVIVMSVWIFSYSFCNAVVTVIGIEDFIYNKLSLIFQSITFYLIFYSNPLGYSIIKSNPEQEKYNN